ncbi:MAG: hypothetical protein S4CHLAM102_05170 [Chlamydiia bacterium]|nr:hypothetical protein [Chlamydiia bacterium]
MGKRCSRKEKTFLGNILARPTSKRWKLRTYFFTLISGLFVVTVALALIVEQIQIDFHLKKAAGEIRVKLHEISLEKQKNIHRYLKLVLGRTQARTDSLLEHLYDYKWMQEKFLPTVSNAEQNNWWSAATLLLGNDWIDLIQVTNEKKLTANIVVQSPYLNRMVHIPLSDKVHAFVIQDEMGNWLGPYIGIPYWMNKWAIEDEPSAEALRLSSPEGQDFWLLFTVESLLRIDPSTLHIANESLPYHALELSIHFKSEELYKQITGAVIEGITTVQNELKSHFQEWIKLVEGNGRQSWITGKLEEQHITIKQEDGCVDGVCRWEADPLDMTSEYQLDLLSHRYDEVGMIYEMCLFTASGIFNYDPSHPNAPIALARLDHDSYEGNGFQTKNALLPTPFIDQNQCPPPASFENIKACLSSTIGVIYQPNYPNKLFFGNSIRLVAEEPNDEWRTGYITIGTNANSILQQLSLATQSDSLLVVGGKAFKGFDAVGVPRDLVKWEKIDFARFANKGSGVIVDNYGQEYYYVHIHPYPDTDVDMFVFKLRESEATLFAELAKKTHKLINTVAWQVALISIASLIVFLIFLDRIIRRITVPIATLANTAQQVKEGGIEEAHVPPETLQGTREVSDLYDSFRDMIEKLKSNENVRSALNKFVSPEIADEVIKGHVELGGEEKLLTVLFIDVRGFTKMTEKMEPKDVLILLNETMTKIAEVIDRHGGVIDKFVGDGAIVLFGVPIAKEESESEALYCALEINQTITNWNIDREKEGLPKVYVGIGINTGEAIVGNMGSSNRFDYTAVGSNVNLASRVCSFAKSTEILITEAVYNGTGIQERFETEALSPIDFKGISEPVPIYRVLGPRRPHGGVE